MNTRHVTSFSIPSCDSATRSQVKSRVTLAPGFSVSVATDRWICCARTVESEQLPARESDPAVIAEQQDLGRWIFQLLGELATSQREVIELWLNDFSYQEISQITGRSEGHVRVIAHRGLSRLREHPRTRQLLDDLPPRTAKPVASDGRRSRQSSMCE